MAIFLPHIKNKYIIRIKIKQIWLLRSTVSLGGVSLYNGIMDIYYVGVDIGRNVIKSTTVMVH